MPDKVMSPPKAPRQTSGNPKQAKSSIIEGPTGSPASYGIGHKGK